MTEWTTIRIRQDAKERADTRKPDHVTWSEWVADEARAPELPTDEIAEAVVDALLDRDDAVGDVPGGDIFSSMHSLVTATASGRLKLGTGTTPRLKDGRFRQFAHYLTRLTSLSCASDYTTPMPRHRHDTYCDHAWSRDDEYTKQCVKCGAYKGVKDGRD